MSALRKFPYTHYLGDEGIGAVVIAIPKCGCSTIKFWWTGLLEGERPVLPSGGIHPYCQQRYSLASMAPTRAERLLNTGLVVTVLRDPFSRLASAFASKFVRRGIASDTCWPVVERVQLGLVGAPGPLPPRDSVRIAKRPKGEMKVPVFSTVDYERGITFRQFVDYVVRTPNPQLDPHWRPQADYIRDTRVDLFGTLEHLQQTLDEALARLGRTGPRVAPPRPKTPQLGETISNGTRQLPCTADVAAGEFRSAGVEPTAEALYDDALREAVRARYAADFALYESVQRDGSPSPLASRN